LVHWLGTWRQTVIPPAPAIYPPVDTKDATAVAAFVVRTFERMHPGSDVLWLKALFRNIQDLFSGRRADYAAIDVRYHDLEHTLQATVCLILLLEGRHRAGVAPKLGPRHVELALAAVLLHDTGYLKLRSDHGGTGAKYTYCHVLRSCAFAASYLPTIDANDEEIDIVLNAINCTGPANDISHVHFRDPLARVIGCALGTADYLGQMSAIDYPDELEALFGEFEEADIFVHVPVSRRVFKSASELIERTPAFWHTFVRRKLETDFDAMYRFLADTGPQARNAYLEAAENNIAEISRRIACPTITVK
jgi:hypothetical protein